MSQTLQRHKGGEEVQVTVTGGMRYVCGPHSREYTEFGLHAVPTYEFVEEWQPTDKHDPSRCPTCNPSTELTYEP